MLPDDLPRDLPSFFARFGTDEQCRDHLFRQRWPEAPILLPGIGAQAGDLEASLHAGIDAAGGGLIVSASRSVIYAGVDRESGWQDAIRASALALRDEINAVRASLAPA